LGHLTHKTHPDMTYNVFSGMLNPTQSLLLEHFGDWLLYSAELSSPLLQ